MEEGDQMEAWKGLRKAIVVLEEEGGWIMEEDRMQETNERILKEGGRSTDMGTGESIDDLENDDSGGRGQGENVGDRESKDDLDDDEKHENDDSKGRGQGTMMWVLGRERMILMMMRITRMMIMGGGAKEIQR